MTSVYLELQKNFFFLAWSGLPAHYYWEKVKQYPDPVFWLYRPESFYAYWHIAPNVSHALQYPDEMLWDDICQWQERTQGRLVTPVDPEYPTQLFRLLSPPFMLFVLGRVDWLMRPQLAVVGADRPSVRGMGNTVCWVRQLADEWVITSRMSGGIDAQAHWAALHANQHTIGIMPWGISQAYPPEQHVLYESLRDNGALISLCWRANARPSSAWNDCHNVLSALVRAVVIMEAHESCQSLSLARQALALGVPVYAIPGLLSRAMFRGCHRLIHEGAQCVMCPDELLEHLSILFCS